MNQKDNKILLHYSKCLKQTKDILGVQISKNIIVHHVENIEKFKNAAVEEDTKKIKYEV